MMQPVPLALMQLRPTLAGLWSAQGWWQGYDEETKRRRMQVTHICENLSPVERKQCLAYVACRNIVARMLVPGGEIIGGLNVKCPTATSTRGNSIPRETDPMYQWFAFPVDAPLRGASRPTRVIQERYLPCDPEGCCGREGYRLVTQLASMPPLPIFDDEEPPVAELVAPSSKDNAQRARRAPHE